MAPTQQLVSGGGEGEGVSPPLPYKAKQYSLYIYITHSGPGMWKPTV